MPITNDDIKNITSEELDLVKKELGLKTQVEVDKAYGKGKEAGLGEAKEKLASFEKTQKELETLKAEKLKHEADTEIEKKITDLKLDLTPEHKEALKEAANGNPEMVEKLAPLITGNTLGKEPNIHNNDGAGNNIPVPEVSAKNENGEYTDEYMAKMNQKW